MGIFMSMHGAVINTFLCSKFIILNISMANKLNGLKGNCWQATICAQCATLSDVSLCHFNGAGPF